MNKEIDIIEKMLNFLKNTKRTHYYCEDSWYSCPRHEDGCSDSGKGTECNCGADDYNASAEALINRAEYVLRARFDK